MRDDPIRIVDLPTVCSRLERLLGNDLLDVWLFGSRQQGTRSKRSDIDILLRLKSGRHLDFSSVGMVRQMEPYIDCFSAVDGTAISIANESQILAQSWEALTEMVGAVRVWGDGAWVGDQNLAVHEVLSTSFPPMTVAELTQYRDPRLPRFGGLLISALENEYAACIEVFPPAIRDGPLSSITRIGDSSSRRELLVRVACIGRIGSIDSAIETSRWLATTESPWVILVGIAAGLRDHVLLGDIVVPEAVYDYEMAKTTDTGDQGAPRMWASDR